MLLLVTTFELLLRLSRINTLLWILLLLLLLIWLLLILLLLVLRLTLMLLAVGLRMMFLVSSGVELLWHVCRTALQVYVNATCVCFCGVLEAEFSAYLLDSRFNLLDVAGGVIALSYNAEALINEMYIVIVR